MYENTTLFFRKRTQKLFAGAYAVAEARIKEKPWIDSDY